MISKKKIKEIENVSFIRHVLKEHYYSFADFPPENWEKEDKKLWDVLTELEDLVKNQIVSILTDSNKK
jgi:hypothetical protein